MALLVLGGWTTLRTWPRLLRLQIGGYPGVQIQDGRLKFPFPAQALMAEAGTFDNELSAYLWFDYLRSRPLLQETEVLLTAAERGSDPLYRIYLVLPNDAVQTIPFATDLEWRGLVSICTLVFSNSTYVEYARSQTSIFIATYNRPVRRNLEELSALQLVPSVARFLVFKSRTDPRIRLGDDPPGSLSREQATEMAADIIAVARFYQLPLDVFLGIGAMENNYLSVRGDLDHAVWKRRPAKDDIILRRGRKRVLVSDYSIGVWQITRETLRYAHELYLRDKRDYSQLPERLRPPMDLVLDLTDSHVLTTYAGLFIRELLDRFNGDVDQAVGAYNGGPRNPNLQYAAGVQAVATYARNVLERVTAINGRSIARASLFVKRAGP